MTQFRLPPPASWAIRTCPEATITNMLMCWRYPPPSVTHDYDVARADVDEELSRLRLLGLPNESIDGMRFYDPCEVVNYLICAGLSGRSPFWCEVVAPAYLKMLAEFSGKPFDWSRPPDFKTLPSRQCDVEFERTYHFATSILESAAHLKLPLPLESREQRRNKLKIQAAPDLPFRQFDNRAEFKSPAGTAGPQRIGFSANLVMGPVGSYEDELSSLDRELYTAAHEHLIVISPAVAALSEKLSDGIRDPSSIVARFFNHIMTSYIAGRVPYHAIDIQAPSDWPIVHGVFDCQIGSALLIALCRSRGIPARLVGGYQVFTGYHAPHFWAEIWFEGEWRPYDFGGWEAMMITGNSLWGHSFVGQCEYRLVFERYPRLTVGPSTCAPRNAWHFLISSEPGKISSHICDARLMRPIIEDRVSVTWA